MMMIGKDYDNEVGGGVVVSFITMVMKMLPYIENKKNDTLLTIVV